MQRPDAGATRAVPCGKRRGGGGLVWKGRWESLDIHLAWVCKHLAGILGCGHII